MQIRCRSCGETVPADDINLDKMLAKCRDCHAVFDFSDQVEGAPAKKRSRAEIALPKGLTVEDLGNDLKITRKWGRSLGCFFFVFALFWNSVVSVFVVGAITGSMKGEGAGFLPIFLIPFVLVGLGTGYAALGLLLNRTVIGLEGGRLSVRSGPIPWPGNKDVETTSIEQLFCIEYESYRQNNVPQYRFAVHAVTREGGKMKLITGMEQAEQALYLEQLLEKHLGIEDKPVRGELK